MAHHKSALKRIRQTKKLRLYNRQNKKVLKLALRSVREEKNYEEAVKKLHSLTSILDKIAARGIMHKNTASNRKSSAARFVNSLKPKTEVA